MNCIPPWLSPINQCYSNFTSNTTRDYIDGNFRKQFFDPQDNFKPTVAMERCKPPCRIITNTVRYLGDKESLDLKTKFTIRFEQLIRVEKKVLAYTFFNFVIDGGSSLGLWLGLSAIDVLAYNFQLYEKMKQLWKYRDKFPYRGSPAEKIRIYEIHP